MIVRRFLCCPCRFFQIVIPCPCEPCAPYKESRPQALQLQASQVFISNSRTGYKCTQTDMLMFLQRFLGVRVYNDYQSFPALNSDVHPLPNSAWINDCSLLGNNSRVDKLMNGISHDVSNICQPSQVQNRSHLFTFFVIIFYVNWILFVLITRPANSRNFSQGIYLRHQRALQAFRRTLMTQRSH